MDGKTTDHRSGVAVQLWKGMSVTLLVLIIVLTFAQVIARFLFNSPFFWTEELARYSYVWLAFIASILVMEERSHIAVELFGGRLSPRRNRLINAAADLMVVVACAILVGGSLSWLITIRDSRSPALDIPAFVLYGVVWVSFVGMGLYALLHCIHGIGRNVDHGPVDPSVSSKEGMSL